MDCTPRLSHRLVRPRRGATLAPRDARAALSGLLVLLAAAGCDFGGNFLSGGETPLTAWAADEMVAVTGRTRPQPSEAYDPDDGAVALRSAGNETVSFQVVVDAGERAVEGLRVGVQDLIGPGGARIDAERVSVFRALPLHVERYPPWFLRLVDRVPAPTDYYDALVPLGADEPLDVATQKRLVLWVDVAVPRDARGGDYAGALMLRSDSHAPWPLRIELSVWDFVLPDARPLPAVGGFAYADLFAPLLRRDGEPFEPPRLDRDKPLVRRGLVLIRELMTLAHRHRVDLFDRRIRPTLRRDAFGDVHLGWEDYDAIVGPYLDGTAFEDRIGVAAWPMPFSADWPDPHLYGGADSPDYAETLGPVVAACARHFADTPQWGDKLFCWLDRGRVEPAGYARHAAVARLVRAAETHVPILSRLPVAPPAASRWRPPEGFAGLVDMSAPPAQWLDPVAARQAARGEHPLAGVWLSPGTPPYLPSMGVLASPADVRAVPWFAMKYRCAGLFLPEVLHWGEDPTSPTASAQTRLFYPGSLVGRKMPLPSVRLKRLRRGLQDLVYLRLLEQHGREEIGRTVLDAMVRYAGQQAAGDNYLDPRLAGWVTAPEAWCQARRLLALEILDAMHRSDRSREELLAQRIAWRTFDTATHEVRVEQIRSRLTPIGGEGESGVLELTLRLELYNEYTRDVDVRVAAEGWPEGWESVNDTAELSPLPAGQRRTVTLRARGAHVPATGDGKLPVPISITTDHRRRRELTAEAAFLLAGQVESAPTVDGKLDDWPLRASNTAGEFRLVGRRGRTGDGLAERQTLAFVLYDRERVYIAFRCDEPAPDELVARRDNRVAYEQLLAVGEDLVEVVLDPGADADGAEDLYHLAVKPNGVLVAERGVSTAPPLGAVRPWPVDASVAVHTGEDFWSVELAVPRAAFGDEAGARFWGVNFARFCPRGAEASSWSGARRYFYHPRSLGTMFLAPLAPPARRERTETSDGQ